VTFRQETLDHSTAAPRAAIIPPIDSAAREGTPVARRRFQKGSVYMNTTRTMWFGMYAEYSLDSQGVEVRKRQQIALCPVRVDSIVKTKRDAQRLLQPYLDKVNASISQPSRERKTITLVGFAELWERNYLPLSKPSTQSAFKSLLKRVKAHFGQKDMRQIDANDLQRLVVNCQAEGLDPKTIRNIWGLINLLWQAALAGKYVDSVLPKPKLPRKFKTKARFFLLEDVARLIASSNDEHRTLYWLLAETGIRTGELAGLRISDVNGNKLSVSQSVWHGNEQTPKTQNAVRVIALSPQLVSALWAQIRRQRTKGSTLLFSSSTGTPLDMDVFRHRKLRKQLETLGIELAGFHAFRHFNTALLDSIRTPLKIIQERMGHALTGSFTLDVYGHVLDWQGNVDAANKAGAVIEQAVQAEKLKNFVNVTAIGSLAVSATD